MFDGIKLIEIDSLSLTQIYLSRKKIETIQTWFTPSLEHFEPICVRALSNDGKLYITDGHTRAFVVWNNGVKQIPCIYDNSDIVTCEIGQIQYKKDIEWCKRFKLVSICSLTSRIISEEDYESLWRGRCEKMYVLECALLQGKLPSQPFYRKKLELEQHDLFIYGISNDYKTIYCENYKGELFTLPFEPLP
jgi:hypothetical protein